jgi:5'-deoxynucleotidase YfbR-like HD superfamily hydrolase
MSHRRGTLYLFSGAIGFPECAPDIKSIAVSLAREGRYAGAGRNFWPVALHTFVVCDMLPDELKIHGLLHDSPECVTGDIPKPSKSDEIEAFEEELLIGIYKSLGVRFPDTWERDAVKREDKKALRGEVYTIGTAALMQVYEPCPEAEILVVDYFNKYSYADMLDANGAVQADFINKFYKYKSMM